MNIKFEAVEDLQMETSSVVTKSATGVKLDVEINIDGDEGNFELYDIETGGESWYAEGCLELDGKSVVGYDGVFDLPNVIKDMLRVKGYNLDEL